MLDRKLRKPELTILELSHICRNWSDIVSLWAFSLMTLRYRYNLDFKKQEVLKHVDAFYKLSQPITDLFNTSQNDLYEKE